MKNTFLLLVLGTLLGACSSTATQEKTEVSNAIPSSTKEINSSRQSDMVDALYQELIEQRPELQTLENQIETVQRAKEKTLEEYNQYNNKNTGYYTNAHQRIAVIKDSLLKNSIELLLKKSQNAYTGKNSSLHEVLAALDKQSTELNDHREALKVILTMNLIEKYQQQQLPDHSNYKSIIDSYHQHIKTADSLMHAK
ncbi:MAG TPA: hypothetical protein VK750_10675 [Cytophagaceae bacterium]|jgi:hypothetical protein|nr:hypothetical protein [Cytophagaceae bacterium]